MFLVLRTFLAEIKYSRRLLTVGRARAVRAGAAGGGAAGGGAAGHGGRAATEQTYDAAV